MEKNASRRKAKCVDYCARRRKLTTGLVVGNWCSHKQKPYQRASRDRGHLPWCPTRMTSSAQQRSAAMSQSRAPAPAPAERCQLESRSRKTDTRKRGAKFGGAERGKKGSERRRSRNAPARRGGISGHAEADESLLFSRGRARA
jgi:hypothetical protein